MKRILSTFLLMIALLLPNNAGATIAWSNNATSLIADSGGISSGATSVTVTTGHGDKFPAVASPHYFMITFVDVSGNREIVKCTARSSGSNTMTIVRGQESTSPRAFAEGSFVDQRITAGSLDEFSRVVDFYENVYLCDASAADQADTVNSLSLASLTGDIGTSLNATIILPHSGTGSTTAYNVLQALNLSAYDNITFIFERGAVLTYAANTISIAIPQAGSYQIFSGTGAITFNAASPGMAPTNPYWWGAESGGTAATNVAAINAALIAGSDIYLPAGTYQTNGTIDVPTKTHFRGAGAGKTIISYTGTGYALQSAEVEFPAIDNTVISDMQIAGPGGAQAGQHGVYIEGWRQTCVMERVWITNHGDAGLFLRGYVRTCIFKNLWIENNTNGWGIEVHTQIAGSLRTINDTTFQDCIVGVNKGGIWLNSGVKNRIINCDLNNTSDGSLGQIKISNSSNHVVSGNYIEVPAANSTGILLESTAWCVIENNYISLQETATNGIGIELTGSTNACTIRDNRIGASSAITGSPYAIDMSGLQANRPNTISQPSFTMSDYITLEFTKMVNDPLFNASFDISGDFALYGENHQYFAIKQRTTELTSMSGATITWTDAIPAGTIVFGMSTRVTILIEGATTFDVGESGGDTDLYIDGRPINLGSRSDIAYSNAAFVAPKVYQSLTSILVTAVGGAANFSAGALRLTIYYLELTPPTT